ncbi:MAG: methylated-DNA--[protein]-cysteine S-methyltransferase [Lachnospiraceae bacterium]|nr:methylated-DNA--[protein]-cysteine S-methyltransferase [Lachnospiraceae bacterium]
MSDEDKTEADIRETDKIDIKYEAQKTHMIYRETILLKESKKQLKEYFAGKRREFDLPISLHGTDFRKKVWNVLRSIPYGETLSYGEVAAQIGNPKASRAVGGANNKNPVMIIVPCHRVIGADGSLTGFGGGLPAKEYLLAMEKGNLKMPNK